jgi:DNA-binding SARP family transcriptional activator
MRARADRSPDMPMPVVDVDVLGPPRISGLARPFRRSAARELVVFLAFHRGGIRQADCAVALWPDRPVCASTMHSTVSDARRALGPDHLPRRGALLDLADSVTTDVDRFTAASSGADLDQLVRAMRLVRGTPFSGLRADWAVIDGTQAQVEGLVVQAALRGAGALVDRGRAVDAEWIVRQALIVSPDDERLYRALLRATHAHGDRARLHRTMAQLVRMAGIADPHASGCHPRTGAADGLRAVHPETAAMYYDLLVGTPASSVHPPRH